MKFRMNCPKCGSTNFSIERDNRSYAPRGQTFEMIFSCRCGKQMFGDQIVKEYDRQKKDYESQRDTVEVEREVRVQRREEEDDDDLDLAESSENREPASRQAAAATDDEVDDDHDDHGEEMDHDEGDEEGNSDICGWHPCSNPPRPNSKYCSRDCSNKNARWRYKQRKVNDKEAA